MTAPVQNKSQQLRDIIKDQYKKCALDPKYFLSRYCYIQHPIKGKMLFNLYDYQQEALQDFMENQYNIVLKGRQIGFSTLVAGYALWLLLFHNDKNILVIATKQDTAKNLVTKVRFMHAELPVWLRGECIEDNKLSLRFANGSQIKAVARSKDAGRSEALSLLILDEAAFIEDAEEIWTSAQATLSTGGKAIVLSTPNGMGNFFHKLWQDAETKRNSFNTIKLDWRVHPERDEEWRQRQTEILGEAGAAQEHDASFIFSGNTVIKPEIIQRYRQTFEKEPIAREWFDSNLWIWERPVETTTYVVCADVARGDGEDYSAFHVLDIERVRQVAEYKGKVPPKEFGQMLMTIGAMYYNALVIPDNSSIGWAAVQRIIDGGYPNLFYMSKDLQVVDVHQQYSTNFYREEKTMVPGFTISARTRPLIIAKLDEYMRNADDGVIIHSGRTLSELETFIWKNGRAEALDKYNDDLVMSLAIGLWVRDTALRLKNERMTMTKHMLDRISNSTVPFVTKNGNLEHNPFTIHTEHGLEDISWLIR
jgi:hypothetical protein